MAKILDKTVIGMNAPRQTNVTWIDTSDGTPVQRNNINGKWKPVGGGAGSSRGSSSDPTESDVNKVWQVTPVQKGTKTEETVIVPEQTLIGGQELEYNDKFVPGAQCVAVVNGVEYRGEVVETKGEYVFEGEFGAFSIIQQHFYYRGTELPITAKLSVIEETPNYDYNWAPGVKIPVPTAEDEGKILVVTKVEGDNTSIIVPEQPIPEISENKIPLTDVDLTKFVVGNTVKVTVNYEESEITVTGVIKDDKDEVFVYFDNDGNTFNVWQADDSLYTDAAAYFSPNSTIKLEYVELNYEYQLQENSGGSSTSNVIWPAYYEYDGNEILATFVPEDVEPNTWCMVQGNFSPVPKCLPVIIEEFGAYVLYNDPDSDYFIDTFNIENGQLLWLDVKQADPDPEDPGTGA